jgi:hypothetical protein
MTKTKTGATPEKSELTPEDRSALLQKLAADMTGGERAEFIKRFKENLWREFREQDPLGALDALERAQAAEVAARGKR